MYKHFFKRVFDFIVASSVLLLISPLFIIVVIGLYFANEGKPFFFQARPGKGEQIFKIVKFKTMNDKKDNEGNLLSDGERLTRLGAFVRKTSLDELPQLINVLKGDMSLIGPRPLLPEYLPFYNEVDRRRHEVTPGITGLAQVQGRNSMKFSKRFELDVYYVDHLSFILDVKIILMTIKAVLFKSSDIVNGQTVEEVDDIGLSKGLNKNYFKNKEDFFNEK